MMKRLYILLILLTAAFWGSGQTYLPDNTFGKTFNRILPFYALGIPNDTLAPPVAYQHYPHLAGKDSILYMWSPSLKRFLATGSRGTSSGSGSSYTFLAPLSNDGGVVSLTSVPWSLLTGKPTTLSGYGITDAVRVSDTAAMLFNYVRKGIAGSSGHTHIGADITDGTTWVRNMFFGGTGVVYNNATGVIAIDSALVRSWLSASAYTFTGPLSESGGTVSITQANGSTNGYLSAVDWTLFNGKVSQDALDDTANALRALIAAATPDSFTYATRRYVDSSVSALSGDFINNSTTQQTANFNITGNGVIGGNLDVTGSGNFAQNRVQLSHATLGGATKWYNTSGDFYSEVNPDQGGYMSSRRFVFNSAVGDPTAGTDYKGYLYMKSGVPYWSYNGTHTAIPLGGGGASTTSDLTDVSDAAPANNTVLTYNEDSAKYVPTAVARYKITDPQAGDILEYDATDSTWTNVPNTGGGTAVMDSLREFSGDFPATGNIGINTDINRIQYRIGGHIFTLAVEDSTATSGPETNMAYDMDAPAQIVTADGASDFNFNLSSAFSIGFWYKALDNTAVLRLAFANSTQRIWEVNVGYSGRMVTNSVFMDAAGSSFVRNDASDHSSGAWHHVVVTYDGSGSPSGFNIYVNGTNDNGTTSSAGTMGALATGGAFRIGQLSDANQDAKQVYLDDLFVSNNALSSGQVTSLYSATGDPSGQSWYAANCIAYWKFNSDLTDEKGTHNGTATTPQYVAH